MYLDLNENLWGTYTNSVDKNFWHLECSGKENSDIKKYMKNTLTKFICYIYENDYASYAHSQSGESDKKIHSKVSEMGDNYYYLYSCR